MRRTSLVSWAALSLAACDLFGPPDEPSWDPLAIPDKPDDPRDCAGPGTSHGLEGEAIHAAYMRAERPDLACGGSWQVDTYLPASWTIEIGQGYAMAPQLAAHPQGGAVIALRGRLTRFDEQGELLWTREVDPDIDSYALRIDEQGRVYASARLDTFLAVLVFDAAGEPIATLSPGNFGSSGRSQLDLWEGDIVLGGYDEVGAVLIRMTSEGVVSDVHGLEQAVKGHVVEVDGQGIVYYGEGPARLLETGGNLITELGELEEPAGDSHEAYRNVAGRESGGFLIAQRGEGGLAVRAIDASGATTWTAERARGEFYSWARALTSNPLGGGVVVGYEYFDDRIDGYDAFITFHQPLIVGFDGEGEIAWADRIAVGGAATSVAVGPGGEVYVAGSAEFRGPEGERDLSPRLWLRRYDP